MAKKEKNHKGVEGKAEETQAPYQDTGQAPLEMEKALKPGSETIKTVVERKPYNRFFICWSHPTEERVAMRGEGDAPFCRFCGYRMVEVINP